MRRYFLQALSFLATLALIAGCEEPRVITPDPNSGPKASEVFASQPSRVWHQIAGLTTAAPDTDQSPGWLEMLNVSLVSARSTQRKLDNYSAIDTLLYNYSSGWYTRSTDTIFGGTAQFQWRYTPNPFRAPGGVPSKYESVTLVNYTEPMRLTTTELRHTIVNERQGSYYYGQLDQQFRFTLRIGGIPASTIAYGAPLFWNDLDCRRNGGLYTSPRGEFRGVGSSELARDSSGNSETYNFEGYWYIPTAPSVNSDIGWVKVGGERFATYFFSRFNSTSGIYEGTYQLSNGDTTHFEFRMTSW